MFPKPSRPKKRYGQHFLKNREACRRIVGSLRISPLDQILEIGPGRGALTEYLVPQSHRLVAIEADRICVGFLRDKFRHHTNLEVIHGNFLKMDLKKLLNSGKWKAVGNLPYNAATPILFRMLENLDLFTVFTFMFQLEVAQRVTSPAGGKDYSFLSVASQLSTVPENILELGPRDFHPQPKIRSAVITFVPSKQKRFAGSGEKDTFLKWVDRLFRHRRKMLLRRVSPGRDLEEVKAVFHRVGLSPQARPQELTVDQWVMLFEQFFS